jgi:hypothetical protein
MYKFKSFLQKSVIIHSDYWRGEGGGGLLVSSAPTDRHLPGRGGGVDECVGGAIVLFYVPEAQFMVV